MEKLKSVIYSYNNSCPHTAISVNYETLYDLAMQVDGAISGYYGGDPALDPLINKLRGEFHPIGNNLEIVQDLFHDVAVIIYDYVSNRLAGGDIDFHAHRLMLDALAARAEQPLDIFTTNHDSMIEHYCRANDLALVDGFYSSPIDNGIRPWCPAVYETENSCVRLYKLHGSVNWRYWEVAGETDEGEVFGISTAQDLSDTVWQDGRKAVTHRRSTLLVGTQIKFYEYSRGQPLEMLCAAKQAWDKLSTLIIIGFSFRDLEVNRLLHYWINGRKERKLLIVLRKPGSFAKAASSFQEWADHWEHHGKVSFYEKDFNSLEWSELETKMIDMYS